MARAAKARIEKLKASDAAAYAAGKADAPLTLEKIRAQAAICYEAAVFAHRAAQAAEASARACGPGTAAAQRAERARRTATETMETACAAMDDSEDAAHAVRMEGWAIRNPSEAS